MRYIRVTAPGGPEMLAMAEGPAPKPGAGEVLIRVTAAGVNRADLLQRRGQYPPPAGTSEILGLEVSGQIVAVGAESDAASRRWRVGDAVCALLAGGGYAEYCVAPAGQCLPVPATVSVADAAAIPEAAATVWANLFEPRRLRSGSLLLIQGGASGVGSMAIQIARCFGARIAATAGSDEKCRLILELGAEKAINYRIQDWAAEIAKWSKPHGVDVILDMIGGDYFPRHISLLAPGGQLVHIATLRGSQAAIDLRQVMSKRLVVTGSTLRSRPVAEKAALLRSLEKEVWPLFAGGKVHPVIFERFPFGKAADAHRMMEAGAHHGKILLEMDAES